MKKEIAIIASDYPPYISGYSDYNYKLISSLQDKDINVFLITSKNDQIVIQNNKLQVKWNIVSIFKIIWFLRKHKIKLINIQYPNSQYGRFNLIPHIITIVLTCLKYKISITLHEYSNINVFRRISEIIFLLFSKQIILTSVLESEAILKKIPFIKKIKIIPIASNVNQVTSKSNFDKKLIICFGKIYPDREIKKVIDLMKFIDTQNPNKYKFKIIGGVHNLYKDYLEEMISYSKDEVKNIEWVLNKSMNEVEKYFKETYIMVLFYNDGASLRRGSMLASIVNGIPLITNKGKYAIELINLEDKGIFYTDFSLNRNREILSKLIGNDFIYNDCYLELKKFSDNFNFERVAVDYEKNFVFIN